MCVCVCVCVCVFLPHGIRRRFVAAAASELHYRHIFGSGDIQSPKELFLDVIEQIAGASESRPFSFQLEDDHAGIVAGGEQIQRRMRRHHLKKEEE